MTTPAEPRYSPRWARRVAVVHKSPFGQSGGAALSLRYGLPDPALFPVEGLREAASQVLVDPALSPIALQYGPVRGHSPLLALVTDKLARSEGLEVQPEQLLVTSGSSGAIGLAARALLDEGDVVLVEAPTFPGALNIFRRAGAQIHEVPMSGSGIDLPGARALLDSLLAQGLTPRLLYTMPTFHNPTGQTLPEAGRRVLLDLAARYELMVIEDDAYGDLYYDPVEGPLPPSLLALDSDGRVIRTGTFSKILTPGMRLGWAAAQPEMVERMLLLKDEGGTNGLAQHIAAEYAANGALEAHIAGLVEAYRAKRDAMLAALERYFPPSALWSRPAGGFFVWLALPAEVDPSRLAGLAQEEGVDYLPGEACFAGEPPAGATYLRLSFSLLNIDEIEEAIKRLARAARALM